MFVGVKYTTSATALGGRDGSTRTEDGQINLHLAVPEELGGREAKVQTLINSSQRVMRRAFWGPSEWPASS